jgi:hypothetical protein
MRTPVLPLVTLVVLVSATATAQEPASRAEAQAQQQSEKAGKLSTARRNFIEQRLLDIENGGGFAAPRGFMMTFGDIKSGSGFAPGVAYGHLFNNGAVVQAKAVYSIRNFKLGQLSFALPPAAGGRLRISSRVRWQDAPSLAFYALGTPSDKLRADYAETKTEVSATAAFRPVRLLRFDGSAGYERFDTGPADSAKPRIETFFTGVPGLNADPDYLHTSAGAGIDSRDSSGYTRRGGVLGLRLHDYRQQNGDLYSFQRLDGVAEQHIPILGGNWVLYAGLRASTTMTDAGQQVPFFLLPDIGGSDLRGYGNYRFRDRHSLVFTAEYRWYAQEFLDAAIFYDAGKAVADRADLDFSGLQSDVGFGLRLHGPQTTALRLEVAHGREGFRLILAFSPVGR